MTSAIQAQVDRLARNPGDRHWMYGYAKNLLCALAAIENDHEAIEAWIKSGITPGKRVDGHTILESVAIAMPELHEQVSAGTLEATKRTILQLMDAKAMPDSGKSELPAALALATGGWGVGELLARGKDLNQDNKSLGPLSELMCRFKLEQLEELWAGIHDAVSSIEKPASRRKAIRNVSRLRVNWLRNTWQSVPASESGGRALVNRVLGDDQVTNTAFRRPIGEIPLLAFGRTPEDRVQAAVSDMRSILNAWGSTNETATFADRYLAFVSLKSIDAGAVLAELAADQDAIEQEQGRVYLAERLMTHAVAQSEQPKKASAPRGAL